MGDEACTVRAMSREQKPYSERTTPQQRKGYRQARMRRARRLYRWLVKQLARGKTPKCALCPATEKNATLDIDHERGKRWKASALRYDARVDRYVKEYTKGVPLRLLCRKCNGRDGGERRAEGRVAARG